MSLKIDYIEFASPDMGTSERFFRQAFGWEFTSYGPDYCGFDTAGVDGGIASAQTPAPPLVILYAEDLDAAEAAVRAAGGEIVAPQFDFPGGRRFHFREPGGNILGVWSKGAGQGET